MVAPTRRSLNKRAATSRLGKQLQAAGARSCAQQQQVVVVVHEQQQQPQQPQQQQQQQHQSRRARRSVQLEAASLQQLWEQQQQQQQRRRRRRLDEDHGEVLDNKARQQAAPFAASKLRWHVLAGICVFGFCNGFASESNSIMSTLLAILDISLERYVYTAQVFHVLPLVLSLPAARLFDRFGTRLAVFVCLLASAGRSCARALLFAPRVAHWRRLAHGYWLVQFALTYASMALYYCLPLKVSEEWFLAEERSLAWSLVCLAPSLGNALACATQPLYVRPERLNESLEPLALAHLASLFVSILALCLSLSRSRPSEGAPSERNRNSLVVASCERGRSGPARQQQQRLQEKRGQLLEQLKQLLANKHLLLHMNLITLFDALYFSMLNIQQDMLQSLGMALTFVGAFLSLNNLLGFLVQLLASARQKPAQTSAGAAAPAAGLSAGKARECRLLLALQCASFLLFCVALLPRGLAAPLAALPAWRRQLELLHKWLCLLASLLFVGVRCAAQASYTEASAQLISGRISEATISALGMALSGLFMAACSLVLVGLRALERAPDGRAQADYTRSVAFAAALALALTCVYALSFRPEASCGGGGGGGCGSHSRSRSGSSSASGERRRAGPERPRGADAEAAH